MPHKLREVLSPLKDGIVANWDIVDNIWDHAFSCFILWHMLLEFIIVMMLGQLMEIDKNICGSLVNTKFKLCIYSKLLQHDLREKRNIQELSGVFVFNVPERDYLDRPTARLIKEFHRIESMFFNNHFDATRFSIWDKSSMDIKYASRLTSF
ncbi:uncharacterized protein LOC130939706 [Arachis stenosperma]|uniref:uncharacterized protein LOC130939706 n=1 Tax=Arachis stenosperma TaxID=217475 RepID=UPI0025AC52E4|nr:uncharacterized protein LOC130939706 [Arachis stenosperma]